MDYKARTLDQILGELGSAYDPQIANIKKRQSLIPQGVKADIDQAKAQKTEAFDEILGGARRRGLGFSGIPLGEQARYASTVFAPEVLRARARGSEQALSLEDAILGINERRQSQAQSIYQTERDRQFQAEQARLAREEAARSRAAATRAASFSPSYGGGGSVASTGGGETANPDRVSAFLEVQQRVSAGSDDRALISDYNATLNSANRGNARDKIKIAAYRDARPDLFRSGSKFGGSFNTPLNSQQINVSRGNTRFGPSTGRETVFVGGF